MAFIFALLCKMATDILKLSVKIKGCSFLHLSALHVNYKRVSQIFDLAPTLIVMLCFVLVIVQKSGKLVISTSGIHIRKTKADIKNLRHSFLV